MKEFKVGEKIVLEVKENTFEDPKHPCKGCFFFDMPMGGACYSMCYSDGKNLIFKEVKE